MSTKPIKILHSADWHYRDRDHDEIEKCVNFLIKTAVSEKPNIIVINGDIFDRSDIKLDTWSTRTVIYQFARLANISPVAVIIGTQTHDGSAAKILKSINSKHQIWVSHKAEQIYLYGRTLMPNILRIHPAPDLILSQFPTPTKSAVDISGGISVSTNNFTRKINDDLALMFEKAKTIKDAVHVFNGHFDVAGSKISKTQVLISSDIKISKKQLELTGADLFMLGHIHMAQRLHDNVFYSGSITRLNFGELEEKGFFVHSIDHGKKITSTFVRTPARKLLKYNFDFTRPEAAQIDNMDEFVLAGITDDVAGTFIKISIDSYQDVSMRTNKSAIIKALTEDRQALDVKINVSIKPRVNTRADAVLQMVELTEKVAELAKQRNDTIEPGIMEKCTILQTLSEEEVVDWAVAKLEQVGESQTNS